jgi:transposase-like protein
MRDRDQDVLKSESWQKHWEAWKESGISQAEYARRVAVNLHQMRYWINKFNRPATPAGITALVKLPQQTPRPSEASIELVMDQRYRLIIRTGFDSHLLHAVLSSLEGRLCS